MIFLGTKFAINNAQDWLKYRETKQPRIPT